MAGSGGTAVVPTNADLSEALEQGALGNRATQTDHAALIGVNSTDLTGTGATVQGALEEIDNVADLAAVATTVATENAVNLAYRPLWSTLTADSADIQNDTLTATGLTVTVGVGTYFLDAFIPYTTPAAQDIQFKFGGTATVTATIGTSDIWIVQKPTGDITAGLAIPLLLPTSWTTAIQILTTGVGTDEQPVIFQGKLVVTVAGTIKVDFAQVVTGAFNTHVSAGSWLKLQRVA